MTLPYYQDARWKQVMSLPDTERKNPDGKHWHALLSLMSDFFARVTALEEKAAAPMTDEQFRAAVRELLTKGLHDSAVLPPPD